MDTYYNKYIKTKTEYLALINNQTGGNATEINFNKSVEIYGYLLVKLER